MPRKRTPKTAPAPAAEPAPAEPEAEAEAAPAEAGATHQAYRFWHAGVMKVKEQVCPDVKVRKTRASELAGVADQIHNAALATAAKIAATAHRLQVGHETLSYVDVVTAAASVAGPVGGLAAAMTAAAEKAVASFNENPAGTGGNRVQKSVRSGLSLSVGPAKNVILEAGFGRASDEGRIALTAVCDCLVGRLWAAAAAPEVAAALKGRTMLTPRHLLLGVAQDPELAAFFETAGFCIGSAGAVPYVNPFLTEGQPAIRKNRQNRYPAGAAARKEIHELQASAEPLTKLAPYGRKIRACLAGEGVAISVAADAKVAIRQAAEAAVVKVARAAQDLDCGAERKSLRVETWGQVAGIMYPAVAATAAAGPAAAAEGASLSPCLQGVRNMLRRAGVARIPDDLYASVQAFVEAFVEHLVAHANLSRRGEKKRVTLMARDVIVGAARLGQVWLNFLQASKSVYPFNVYRVAIPA